MSDRPPLLRVTGRLDAVALILDLPAERVTSLLPPGLELLPQSVLPAGRHPLILLCGEQSAVGLKVLPGALAYLELVIALPFVRPQDGPQGPFCYLPILLLDRRLPTVLGRWLYGFAKRRVAWQQWGDGFRVARLEDGAALLSARFEAIGPRDRAGKLADVARVRCLFEQPLINRGRGAAWRYARFDFALARAAVQPLKLEVVFHRALLPGMPVGPAPLRVPGPGGLTAFRLETMWTLSRIHPDADRQPP